VCLAAISLVIAGSCIVSSMSSPNNVKIGWNFGYVRAPVLNYNEPNVRIWLKRSSQNVQNDRKLEEEQLAS